MRVAPSIIKLIQSCYIQRTLPSNQLILPHSKSAATDIGHPPFHTEQGGSSFLQKRVSHCRTPFLPIQLLNKGITKLSRCLQSFMITLTIGCPNPLPRHTVDAPNLIQCLFIEVTSYRPTPTLSTSRIYSSTTR